MRKLLVVGVIAAIASLPAMADAVRAWGAGVPAHRAPAAPSHPHHHDFGHAPLRPVIRYVPVFPLTTPYAGALPRLAVPVPASPYFVVTRSPAAREVMTFSDSESLPNWNWTRVESATALVPRNVANPSD